MVRAKVAYAAAIALGLLGCEVGAPRPAPLPTPSPTPTPAPGTRWRPLGNPGNGVAAVQFVNPQVAWAVGGSNLVRRSEDGGQTWAAPKALPSSFNPNVSAFGTVSFVDPRLGFLGGSYGVFKTEDGGESWSRVQPFDHDNGPPPADQQAYVKFRDHQHGVVYWRGQLHRTMDGGATWQASPIGEGGFRALGMIGNEFAVLTDATLWKSKPDGSWGEVALPVAFKPGLHNDPNGAFHFLDDQHGWVFHDGTLYRTVDGGRAWIEQTPDHRGGEGAIVRFIDPARGWVLGKGYFKATRTGGATWADVPYGGNLHQERDRPAGMQILDAAHVYLYGGTVGLSQWEAP